MLATPRAIPVRARTLALCLPPLLTGLLILGAAPAAAAPTTTAPVLDPLDRASVTAAYRDVYLPAAGVTAPTPTAAALAACDAGTTPAALQSATVDAVNFFRGLSRVGPVTLDPGLSAKAQQAALIGYANGVLDHTPPRTATCWSEEGASAANSSNLGLGYGGADVVEGYMDDAGQANVAAGHRWWLQRPSTQTMGNGTVGWANALWVDGATAFTTGPRYTAWPPVGYLPAALEPGGRWSLTSWDPDYDLSGATVQVTGPDGTALRVVRQPSSGTFGSLVFEVGTLPAPVGGTQDTYTVQVSGILKRGEPASPHRYQVNLFDPLADVALEARKAPTITGSALVGSTLTASEPVWSLAQTQTTYQWYRGGSPISGATGTALTLGPADTGERISVRATGTPTSDRAPVTVTAPATAVVRAPAVVSVGFTGSDPGRVRLDIGVDASGEGLLSGSATVTEGSTVLATVPLRNGSASWEVTGVDAGQHTYVVTFPGTDRVAPGTRRIQVGVLDRAVPTLDTTATSTAVGRLDLTVDVAASDEQPLAGTVSVHEGGQTRATGLALVDGRAVWSAAGLSPGRHTYTLTYSGTDRVQPADASLVATVKAKVKPTLELTATSPSSGKVALGVVVDAAGQPPLTGTVTVKEGRKTLKSKIAVRSGRASWSAGKVKAGRHTYSVRYSGTSEVTSRTGKVSVSVED